jgi:AsmA protein
VLGVTQTLDGTAGLTGEKGNLVGLDVAELLRRLQRRPLSGGGDFRTGRTPYDKISMALKIVHGTAKVQSMSIVGPEVKVALAGSASIPQRNLDLTGTATLTATSRQDPQPFALPFFVQGSWDDPVMLPDAEALIRRSGAAAPLLNAVRERNARDAVRSVLERLTGGTLPGPAAAVQSSAAPGAAQKP